MEKGLTGALLEFGQGENLPFFFSVGACTHKSLVSFLDTDGSIITDHWIW